MLCEPQVLPDELEPAWEEEEEEEERLSRALLLPSWLQGKGWDGRQPRHKPHLPCQILSEWAHWGGNVTL